MTDRQLMQLALDAMLTVTDYDALHKAKIALRKRLAQPEQKPVAETQRLADQLEWAEQRDLSSFALRIKAAAELRRLSAVEQAYNLLLERTYAEKGEA